MKPTGSALSDRPLVSVVIPVYNHEAYVGRAIESVLTQTYRNVQLIAIDDGSTDGSLKVVRSFDDPRLEVHHQRNRGAHNTLNRGLRLARGKYVSILNSDDIYDRRRLARFVGILERKPAVAACFSHIDVIDERERVVSRLDGAAHNPTWRPPGQSRTDRTDPLIDLLGGNYLAIYIDRICVGDHFLGSRVLEPCWLTERRELNAPCLRLDPLGADDPGLDGRSRGESLE